MFVICMHNKRLSSKAKCLQALAKAGVLGKTMRQLYERNSLSLSSPRPSLDSRPSVDEDRSGERPFIDKLLTSWGSHSSEDGIDDIKTSRSLDKFDIKLGYNMWASA
jgi:hypothetical protein